MNRFLLYGLPIVAWLLGSWSQSQANLDGLKSSSVVIGQYNFTDGEWARGFIFFKDGFKIPANAKVTLGIYPPVEGYIDMDVTSTLALERPLYVGPTSWGLAGTIMNAPGSSIVKIFSDASQVYLQNNVYFPDYTTIDFRNHIFTAWPAGNMLTPHIYVGTVAEGKSLTIKNTHMLMADVFSTTWPVRHNLGEPVIQSLRKSTALFDQTALHFVNVNLEVLERATMYNMFVDFTGNCPIKNSNPFDAVNDLSGAKRALLRFDTTVTGMNVWIGFNGPASVSVGPEVDISIGDLGVPSEVLPGIVYPFGGFMAGTGSPFLINATLMLLDATLTISRPCFVEGGVRLSIQGHCDLYSTATTQRDQVLTFGRSLLGQAAVDGDLDIQPSSVLNVHNMVLRNNNTP